MSVPTRLVTADELLAMPDESEFTYELVRGRLIRMSRPGARHGVVCMRLARALDQFSDDHNLGIVFSEGTGFKLESDPDTVRGPDVSFVRRERVPASGVPEKHWVGPPDLAVEVMSPNDRPAEVEAKIAQYLELGVRLVWWIRPQEQTVTAYRPGFAPVSLKVTQELDGSEVVPGFRFPIARLLEAI
jgi:Uma2 family endonuclease